MALSTEEIKRQGTRVQEETQNMNRKCGELKEYCSRIADKLRESDDASAQKCANEWLTIGETFSKIGLKFYNYGNKLSTSLYQYPKENEVWYVLIYIIKNNRLETFTLPLEVSGNYWITDTDENNVKRNLINMEEY